MPDSVGRAGDDHTSGKPDHFQHRINNALDNVPSYPDGRFRGLGVVLFAGGHRLLLNAFIALKFIRKHTLLPVELYYAGPDEMPPQAAKIFLHEFKHLSLKDLSALRQEKPFTQLNFSSLSGVWAKPLVLLHSSFKEALFVDADNMALKDVEPLFTSEEFVDTGALFWPDFLATRTTCPPLMEALELAPMTLERSGEFESGQMLVDKERCWKALWLAGVLNADNHGLRAFVHAHTMGDKDTFRLAFLKTQTPYHLVGHEPLPFGNDFIIQPIPRTGITFKIQHKMGSFYATGMLQHGLQGDPLFAHKTVVEWDPDIDFVNMALIKDGAGRIRASSLLAAAEEEGYKYVQEFNKKFSDCFPPQAARALQKRAKDTAVWCLDRLYPFIAR